MQLVQPDLSGMLAQASQALLLQLQHLLIQVLQMPELMICTSTPPPEIHTSVQLQVMPQMLSGFMRVISKASRATKVIQVLLVMESPKPTLHMRPLAQIPQRRHLDGRILHLP